MNANERITPIKYTDKDTGNVYELDFCRESVKFAEARGFKTEDVSDYPVTKIPEFWFYAFRMHHKAMAKNQTDALLEKMGGLTPNITERLVDLYNQAATSNIIQDDEDLAKNARVTVEL
jgi:hypothetical protein